MTSTTQVNSPDTSPCASCCHESKTSNPVQAFLQIKIVENVCRVALGIFAAMTAPNLFVISFGIGATASLAYTFYEKFGSRNVSVVEDSRPACAQGFMEYLSGTKFPAQIIQIVTAIFIAEHVHHNPSFYVPFCGVFLGFWTGKQATLTVGRQSSQQAVKLA